MIDFSQIVTRLDLPQRVQDAIAGQSARSDTTRIYSAAGCAMRCLQSCHVPGRMDFLWKRCGRSDFRCGDSLETQKSAAFGTDLCGVRTGLETVGCEIQYVQTAEADGFALPMDFAEQITEDIDMVFLCNPNNPTGNLLSREETERVIRRAGALDCTVVLDECFLDFVESRTNFRCLGNWQRIRM